MYARLTVKQGHGRDTRSLPTCGFQQCGILTSVNYDEPVQPPFKLRNSVSSLLGTTHYFSVRGGGGGGAAKISIHYPNWMTPFLTKFKYNDPYPPHPLETTRNITSHVFKGPAYTVRPQKISGTKIILTDFKNATLTSLYIFLNTVVCKIPSFR